MALIFGVACSRAPIRETTELGAKAAELEAENTRKEEENKQRAAAQQVAVPRPALDSSADYHFALAQAYVTEGNPDRAIEEYKLTLAYDPASSLVRVRLAGEYAKKGMVSAALEECRAAVDLDPKFVEARLMLAGILSTLRETNEAIQQYDAVLKIDPSNEEAVVYKAQTLSEGDQADQAIGVLKEFGVKNQESVLCRYYLGRMMHQQGKYKEAEAAYRNALDLRPSFAQAGLALGYLYEEQRKSVQALDAYQETFERTQDLTAANRIATILLKEEKYQAALPYLEVIEAADPEDLNVRVKLGLIAMELKQFDKAEKRFLWILERNPGSDRVSYYLGNLYEEIKAYDKAIEALKKVPISSKMYGDAVLHISYLYKSTGRMNEAIAEMQEAVKNSPKNPGLWVFHASLLEENKELQKAGKILEEASSRFPEDERINYYLGSVYDRLGNWDRGVAQMERILSVNPNNVDALNYLGYTWTTKNVRLDDAEKLLKRALELKPDNGYVQDSWGWHLYMRGRFKDAVVELEKAVKLKPDEPTILEHLADAYARLNLKQKASQMYRDASRLTGESSAREALETKARTLDLTSDSGRAPASE